MAQHDLVDESGLAVPAVTRLRVRQCRHEFEVLEPRRDGRELLEVEQDRRGCGPRRKTGPASARHSRCDRPGSTTSGDMPEPPPISSIGPGRASRRKQVPYGPLAITASPTLNFPSSWDENAPFGYFLMMKRRLVPSLGRIRHRKRAGDGAILKRQIDILSGPEFQRLLDLDFQQPDVGRQRADPWRRDRQMPSPRSNG